ncbi:hypothetical protein Nmel_015952 [Mimus melanotis]
MESLSDQQLDCALDLMRRLPPQQIEKNLSDLIDLAEPWRLRVVSLPEPPEEMTELLWGGKGALGPGRSEPGACSWTLLCADGLLAKGCVPLVPSGSSSSAGLALLQLKVPSLCEDLLSSVDQPLKIARDKVVGKDYLLCDYNRDGDSYRSPWSNKYDPPLEDGAMPSARLRKLEVEANNAFDQYRDLCGKSPPTFTLRKLPLPAPAAWGPAGQGVTQDCGTSEILASGQDNKEFLHFTTLLSSLSHPTVVQMYFEGGVSSVYLWDLDHGFAGVILIKKAGDGSKKIKGCWDSIHVVEVQEKSSGRTAHYKLTSTVMLWLQTNKTGSGTMNLGGSLTRQSFSGDSCFCHRFSSRTLDSDVVPEARAWLQCQEQPL